VEVQSGGHALSGMLVLTRIVMREKQDYWGIFGPTDSAGRLTITKAELLRAARATAAYHSLEFADAEQSFGGLIEVRVLDETGLVRAVDAAAELPDYPYAPGHLERLHTAYQHLLGLGRLLIEAYVTSVGGNAEVRAEQPI
jgi:hypothetical protein